MGKANDARQRFAGHGRDANRHDTPVYAWWRELNALGLRPLLEVLEVVTAETWEAREREWISIYRLTDDLLNKAPGGNAPFCPPDVRARNGAATAKTRCSTPFKARVYELKRNLMQAARRGALSDGVRVKLRRAARLRPELFACFAGL